MREHVTLELPPELLDPIIEAVTERVLARLDQRDAVEPYLNVEQTAAYLACPTSRVYALTSARRIPCRRDGSRVLFRPSELDRWLDHGGATRP